MFDRVMGFRLTRRQMPIAIALVYAVLGAGWVLLSERTWLRLSGLPAEQVAEYRTYDGLFYVTLSSLLIWWL